jgi:hypothetical protein
MHLPGGGLEAGMLSMTKECNIRKEGKEKRMIAHQ